MGVWHGLGASALTREYVLKPSELMMHNAGGVRESKSSWLRGVNVGDRTVEGVESWFLQMSPGTCEHAT